MNDDWFILKWTLIIMAGVAFVLLIKHAAIEWEQRRENAEIEEERRRVRERKDVLTGVPKYCAYSNVYNDTLAVRRKQRVKGRIEIARRYSACVQPESE